MATATLTVNKYEIIIKTPYKLRFINLLKESIPSQYRAFNRDDKTWEVDIKYLQQVKTICSNCFSEVILQEWESKDYVDNYTHDITKYTDEIQRLRTLLAQERRKVAQLEKTNRNSYTSNGSDFGRLGNFVDKNMLKKLHALLAFKYHPDRGGSEVKMKEINCIFDKIRG